MTLRFLLDTSTVSSPISKIPDLDIVEQLDEYGHECAIAAPVWHELTYGCSRLPRGQRRAALQTYLTEVVRASFPILPYDDVAATWHGHERARLEHVADRWRNGDGQIAAIAHANRLAFVTINTRDFSLTGLKVENWSKRRARS